MNRVLYAKLLIVFVVVLSSYIARCQTIELYNPIALPLSISGSFGEIRSDHFHSGVDFRTNGKTGFRVYSSDDGFISRIKISANGFGKTIYIEHPNGLTTVYAHLERFSDNIAKYVENAQYTLKSYEVELFPTKDELMVLKGEIIAFSGNSGSSGGPHLHFEVRHTPSQIPVAPLNFFNNWKDVDSSAPTINKVFLYQIDSINNLKDSLSRIDVKFIKRNKQYVVSDTINANGKVGLGIESFDFVNEQSNRCGFRRISLIVNEQNIYTLNLDSFSFAETKYVNSILDFTAKTIYNDEIAQLWVDENNKFSGLKYSKNRGIINVVEGEIYKINIEIEDHSRNMSTLSMIIKGKYNQNKIERNDSLNNNSILEYYKEHKIYTDKYDILIPKDALYHNLFFYHFSEFDKNLNQQVYHIHTFKTPIHKKFKLKIKDSTITTALINKAYIGYIGSKGTEYCESIQSNYSIEAICSKFGKYIVKIDTMAPQIKPVNISNRINLTTESHIKFQLNDDTGINTYNGYIDNNWILFEWDPKSSSLTGKLDKSRIEQKKWHTLQVDVTDKLHNKAQYSCEFYW